MPPMRPSAYAPPVDTRVPSPPARAVAVWTGALGLVLLVLVVAEWGPLLAVDRAVAEALHASAVRGPELTRVNRLLSDWVWDPWTMRALVVVAVVALWRRGERWPAGRLVVASAVTPVAQHGLKAVVGRERPQWPDPVDGADFAAFPSGHAMTAAVTFGLLWWVAAHRAWSPSARGVLVAVGAVSVVAVGWTRVYLGVHWLSDVLGGWLLGACVVAVAVAAPLAPEQRRP